MPATEDPCPCSVDLGDVYLPVLWTTFGLKATKFLLMWKNSVTQALWSKREITLQLSTGRRKYLTVRQDLSDVLSTSLPPLRSRDVVRLAQGQVFLSLLLFTCRATERQSSMVAKSTDSRARLPEFKSGLCHLLMR